VTQTMFWDKCRRFAVVALLAVLLVTAGGLTWRALAGEGPPPQKASPPPEGAQVAEEPQPKPAALQEKKGPTERDRALAKAAEDQYTIRWKEYLAGKTVTDFVLPWSVNWLKAQLKLCDKKADVIAAYEAHLERMKQVEDAGKQKFEAGAVAGSQYYQATYYRIEAEIWLEEARARK
jgi:hypothetical protein